MTKVTEIAFEAMQALCASLDFEQGLNAFFQSLRKHFPILSVIFGRFDEESQSIFLLSYTSKLGTDLLLKKVPYTARQIQVAKNIDFYNSTANSIVIIQDYQSPLADMFFIDEVPTAPPVCSIRIATEHGFYGGLSCNFHKDFIISPEVSSVLKILEPCLRIFISSFMRYWELEELKNQVYQDNIRLRQEISGTAKTAMIGSNGGLSQIMQRIRQIAPLDISVLINGETGTGKEVLAKVIYEHSLRATKPFITINCAAIPPTLIDNELFGHEKGAFTGANTKFIGRFERANGGTIFLDEIAELPLDVQARLLRVLQEHTVERIGSHQAIPVDFRLIAATHKDLKQMVIEGSFREDLYYRLNVAPITIPPLRERKQDIPVLVNYFLDKAAKRFGLPTTRLSQTELSKLANYDFPGNIRELQNLIEVALATSNNGKIIFPELKSHKENSSEGSFITPYAAMQKSYLEWALKQAKNKIRGENGAAELLDMHHATLRSKLVKYKII